MLPQGFFMGLSFIFFYNFYYFLEKWLEKWFFKAKNFLLLAKPSFN